MVTDSGIDNHHIFDFSIPRGATGATGPMGPHLIESCYFVLKNIPNCLAISPNHKIPFSDIELCSSDICKINNLEHTI